MAARTRIRLTQPRREPVDLGTASLCLELLDGRMEAREKR